MLLPKAWEAGLPTIWREAAANAVHAVGQAAAPGIGYIRVARLHPTMGNRRFAGPIPHVVGWRLCNARPL